MSRGGAGRSRDLTDTSEIFSVQGQSAKLRGRTTSRDLADTAAADGTVRDYDKDGFLYHHYLVETCILTSITEEWNPKSVYAAMLEEARFIAPSEDRSPVEDGKVTRVIIGIFPSYIKSTVDRANLRVTNFTLRWRHILHPGRVHRTIVQRGNQVWVVTEGEGQGISPTGNELLAPSVWRDVDNLLLYRIQFPLLYQKFHPKASAPKN